MATVFALRRFSTLALRQHRPRLPAQLRLPPQLIRTGFVERFSRCGKPHCATSWWRSGGRSRRSTWGSWRRCECMGWRRRCWNGWRRGCGGCGNGSGPRACRPVRRLRRRRLSSWRRGRCSVRGVAGRWCWRTSGTPGAGRSRIGLRNPRGRRRPQWQDVLSLVARGWGSGTSALWLCRKSGWETRRFF